MRRVAADVANESAFNRIDEVLGRVTGVSFSRTAGHPELAGVQHPGAGVLDPRTGPGVRSVRAGPAGGVGERARRKGGRRDLLAGQRVDLIVTMAINPEVGQPPGRPARPDEFIPGPSTKVTLQSLKILARNGPLHPADRPRHGREDRRAHRRGGQFTMVLRPDIDDRTAKTEGSTIDRSSTSTASPFRYRRTSAGRPPRRQRALDVGTGGAGGRRRIRAPAPRRRR